MDRQLSGPRVRLRPPQAGDGTHAFARWAAHPPVLRHLGWPAHGSAAETERQLDWEQMRWLKKTGFTWMLLLPDARGPVGQVQLLPQTLGGPSHHLRLGCVLAPAWQGQGLMREALAVLLPHALRQPRVWRVDALVDLDNLASQRLFSALGLVREGCLHRVLPPASADQAPRDAWVYAAGRDWAPPGAPGAQW